MNTKSDIQTFEAINKPVICLRDVHKSFHTNVVLRGFNLDVYKGENVAVLGKSGSGKSVLIKCIIGLVVPDKGIIEVLGKNIPELAHEELDQLRSKIGFLFQSNALYDSMTIRKNLEFPLRYHAAELSEGECDERVMEALSNVGLEHTIDMMPSELSGGMKKRIALARTLILKPEIILYDEPTAGLDPITGAEISHLMRDLATKYNTSAIIITHDLDCVKIVADRLALLIDGVCYADGRYEELKESNDMKVKQFFINS